MVSCQWKDKLPPGAIFDRVASHQPDESWPIASGDSADDRTIRVAHRLG